MISWTDFSKIAALCVLAAGTPALAESTSPALRADTDATLRFSQNTLDPGKLLERYETASGAFKPSPRDPAVASRSIVARDAWLPTPIMQSRPDSGGFAPVGETIPSSRDSLRLNVGNYWSIGAFR